MKYNPADFYNYFRECYSLDNKEFQIENILATKYPYKWFVDKQEEFLSENYPVLPYFNKKSEQLIKDLEIYKLEKDLFYGYLFMLSKKDFSLGNDKRICAPLLLFPVKLEAEVGEYFLRISREEVTINRFVLSQLELRDESKTKDRFCAELIEFVLEGDVNTPAIGRLLDAYFLDIDVTEFAAAPYVWSVTKIRNYLTQTDSSSPLKFVPAAGTVFVEKSSTSLMVIEDLTRLSALNDYNNSLTTLGDQKISKEPPPSLLKNRLNNDQYKALQNASKFDNSVIIGPPGTGKSYTISAIAANALINNESVLVVSKTKQSVQVVRKMLEKDFQLKNHIVQTSGSRYKISLKSKVKNLLSSFTTIPEYLSADNRDISRAYKELVNLEQQFENRVARELSITELQFSDQLNFSNRLKKFYLQFISRNLSPVYKVMEELSYYETALDKRLLKFIRYQIKKNKEINLQRYRAEMVQFQNALHAYNFTQFKETLNTLDYEKVLKNLPLWLVHLTELNAVAPLKKDIFDLVIIDEATQCDIASVLPAIYRAKRVVVVGDPNQLSHYSFVSRSQQSQLLKKYGLENDEILNYRERSILDFYISNVQNQEQVTFLKEHYRSTPSIIEFSNQNFYEGNLQILKSTPDHTAVNQIKVVPVSDATLEQGINKTECYLVINHLKQMIADYREMHEVPSIGIICPLSKQVTYMRKIIQEDIALEDLKKHDILCGSPYHFQGSERDIILFSLGLCDESHHAAFYHVMDPKVFNVSITRAKSQQIVFKSVSDQKLKKYDLLAEYFSFIDRFEKITEIEENHDLFQLEIKEVLLQLECDQIYSSYPLAGSLLDLLVLNDDHYYFIDLIGYPGLHTDSFPIERYRTLARIGIKSIPLHWTQWKKNPNEIIDLLKQIIKE